MTTKKIGFCCKWIDGPSQINGVKQTDTAKQYNTGTTTVAWLKRQTTEVAEQRLWDLMESNIEATRKLVDKVGTLDEHLRMVRISSDILPVYTESNFSYFWQRPDVMARAGGLFREVGELARNRGVRLSFHPGQFCVLASDNPLTVERSIAEFEYHADMARWMGYGATWHDHGFKINVHISGRQGAPGVRAALNVMTPEARNLISIENEEISHGLDDVLQLADICPIVLDIHHNWVREGEYINAQDDRVKRVIDSWRGVRPTLHYSVSREDILVGHALDRLPGMEDLLALGLKKQKLRAHSNFYWNTAVNDWALTFLPDFDIQCESKAKNLASHALFQYAKEQGLING